MTTEQRAQLMAHVDAAERSARAAYDLAYGPLYAAVDPETRGHISIALQHIQRAQQQLQEGAAHE